jgi:pyridoxamine-phosphate oxidase
MTLTNSSNGKIKVLDHSQYFDTDHLSPSMVASSPFDQFRVWFDDAMRTGVQEPEAMTLATANSNGIPSARTVLLKELDARGFVFYTNYTSRKSKELLENPFAALNFYWREVHRAVRVVGKVEKVCTAESDEYFHSRPFDSQVGAWASKQSTVVGEGEVYARSEVYRQRFILGDTPYVPLPEFWGGWRVIPEYVHHL